MSALPPRNLVALILGIAFVPLAILLWLGSRLLEQDRILEAQQARQRIEFAADLVVAALQRVLSLSHQRLASGVEQWPEGAVAVKFENGAVEVHPRGRVAYLPVIAAPEEAPPATFAEGEILEFQKQDHLGAAQAFGKQANSSDATVRAGALLRQGRNLAKAGRVSEALAAYGRLARIDGAWAGGAPAPLTAAYARCELLVREKREAEVRAEAQRLANELHSGRWELSAPLYWLYAKDAARWSGDATGELREAEIFAEAVAALWDQWRLMPASGQRTLEISGTNLAVLWQSPGGSFRAQIASPGFAESHWMPAAAAVAKQQGVAFYAGDAASTGRAPVARRRASEAGLPWDIVTVSLDSAGHDIGFAQRRRLLIAGFLLLVSMVLAASYFIFRAVARELAVARLQSDFVAAVSHEFRTPLTALRQFTERLREHHGLSQQERQVCYDAQSRATDRLLRLVESLLDFGRMEAGARRYRFEQRDCADLVRRVVEDFRSQAESEGYQIDFEGNGSAEIQTDSEALSRAVRNLLDNAVKYSPDHRRVEVGLYRTGEDVHIAVRDRGIGIPAHERAQIFSKFLRGEQTRIRGIKGTGIGLAMVEEIVRAHRGRIELESEPGRGSTFTIVLPARS